MWRGGATFLCVCGLVAEMHGTGNLCGCGDLGKTWYTAPAWMGQEHVTVCVCVCVCVCVFAVCVCVCVCAVCVYVCAVCVYVCVWNVA